MLRGLAQEREYINSLEISLSKYPHLPISILSLAVNLFITSQVVLLFGLVLRYLCSQIC